MAIPRSSELAQIQQIIALIRKINLQGSLKVPDLRMNNFGEKAAKKLWISHQKRLPHRI